MKKENSSTLQRLKINALSNVVLGVLVLSIGALCLAPMDDTLQAGARDDSFRNGNSQNGVSLLWEKDINTKTIVAKLLSMIFLTQSTTKQTIRCTLDALNQSQAFFAV